MPIFRPIVFLLLCASLLAGCKKSGPDEEPEVLMASLGFKNMGPNPSPVANQQAFTIRDDVGKTFRAYFAQGVDGETVADAATTSFGVVSIKFVDEHTILVGTTEGQTMTYSYSTSQSAGVGYTYDTFKEVGGTGVLDLVSYWFGDRSGGLTDISSGGQLGVQNGFQFGHVADPKILSGTAWFHGTGNVFLAEVNGPQQIASIPGQSNLSVDFGTGEVRGDIFQSDWYAQPYAVNVSINTTLNGSEFVDKNAYIEITTPANFWAGGSGQAAGQIMGVPGTLSVGGAFGGPATGSSFGGRTQDFTISGTFRGDE